MIIGIDYSSAVSQQAGISRYTRELVKHLLQIDKQNNYQLYSFFGSKIKEQIENQKVKKIEFSANGRSMRLGFLALRFINLSPDWLVKGIDVFHSTDFAFPAPQRIPSVLTIHDLAFLRFPQYFTWQNKTYMKAIAKFSAKQAKAIIAVSEATKVDIVNFLGVKEDKVQVIHSGIGDIKRAIDADIIQVKQKYNLPQNYGLFVGTIEPRKNISLVLKAISRLKKEQNKLDWQFVITGGKGWLYKEIFDLVKDLNISKYIRFIGFVPDKELPALYTGAKFFVYPSIYEGFGFPPLEAMSCGTPVIYANTPALVEMIGKAGLCVNPYNDEELAIAITKILSDDEITQKLSVSGLERAKTFSWAKTAKKTLNVYNKVAELNK